MATLISPRDKKAPYFDGKNPKELLDFLAEYDLISAAANITGQDKCQGVINYVHRWVAELWKSFATYSLDNWDNFKTEILKSYPEIKQKDDYTLGRVQDILNHEIL